MLKSKFSYSDDFIFMDDLELRLERLSSKYLTTLQNKANKELKPNTSEIFIIGPQNRKHPNPSLKSIYNEKIEDIIVEEKDESSFDEEVDIQLIIAELKDQFSNSSVDICTSEKSNQCQCKGECLCEDEDYIIMNSVTVEEASNCQLLFHFDCKGKITFGRFKNICVFSLNKETDEEIQLLEIKKKIVKHKKKKVVESCEIETKALKKNVSFECLENVDTKGCHMDFKVSYMQYKIM
jgi:hypothetical protein